MDARGVCGVSLTSGFVKNDCRGGGSIQRFDAAGHGNADARIGAALDLFGKTGALVSDEESYGLAPIDFPRSEERLFSIAWFVDARSESADAGDFELRKKNRKRHPRENRKMQSSTGGGAQCFRRERVCSAADAGSSGGGASRAERGSSPQDRPNVSGILNTGQDDQ